MSDQKTGAAAPNPAAGDQNAGNNPPATAVKADPKPEAAPKTTQVPLTVVEALRDELKQIKTQNDDLQNQVSLYRANQSFAPPVQQPAAAPPAADSQSDLESAVDGLGDTDVITGKELRKLIGALKTSAQTSTNSPAVEQRLAKMEVALMDPQYETTIRNYLPSMVNSNPGLINMIQSSPNPLLAALTYARLNPQFIAAGNQQAAPAAPADPATGPAANGTNPAVPINPQGNILDQIDAIIANSNKPGAPDQVGGQGAISEAGRYATMSDEEFDKHVNKVVSGFNK
jgi:hypothetical protein